MTPLEEDKEAKAMQQQSSPSNYNEFMLAINPMMRQLDRLEERTRDIVTRADLEALRKELVAKDSMEPQLSALRGQIVRVNDDRIADKASLEKRIDELETEQMSKQDRLWSRIIQAIAIAGFALALFEFLAHIKWLP